MDSFNHNSSGAEGGPIKGFEKPMDKAPKQYTSNESVPEDGFQEEVAPDMHESTMDLSTKFPT